MKHRTGPVPRSIARLSMLTIAVLAGACNSGGGRAPMLPSGQVAPAQNPGPSTRDLSADLFVANAGDGSVLLFKQSETGDVAPAHVIAGRKTLLVDPDEIAVDWRGNIYVANYGILPSSIFIFKHGEFGNLNPRRILFGNDTHLRYLRGLAVDSQGDLWVGQQHSGASPPASVVEFGPHAAGNASPIRHIRGSNTGLAVPVGLAVDAAGQLYVANGALGRNVLVFAPGARGNVAPIRAIGGRLTHFVQPYGLAVDGNGTIYVADVLAKSVFEFGPAQNGNVRPMATITGSRTGLQNPLDVVLDGNGNLWVTNATSFAANAPYEILEFAAGSQGDVAPIRAIAGPRTRLNIAQAMAVMPASPATTPTPTPYATPTPTPSPYYTPTPTPSPYYSPTPTPSPYYSPTPTPSPAASSEP